MCRVWSVVGVFGFERCGMLGYLKFLVFVAVGVGGRREGSRGIGDIGVGIID